MPQPIESLDYWQSFTVTERDLDRIEEMFYEDGIPHTLQALSERVVRGRIDDVAAERRRQMDADAKLYQPKQTYAVGDRVRFPALNDLIGTVEAIRPGENPNLSDFQVIRVRFNNGGGVRDFASSYTADHSLNADEAGGTPSVPLAVGHVTRALAQKLVNLSDYVAFGDLWFRRDLLLEVHVGHLNIAEAVVDVAGEPQPTPALLAEMELPPAAPATRAFALNFALAHYLEGRFANVGTPASPRWALRQGGSA